MPSRFSSRSNGAASSRLAPRPVMISSGGPVPETEVCSRTPSTSNLVSRKGTDTGDVPSDDQRLNGLGALVGVQRLDVGHVPHDVEVEQDAVAAEEIAGLGDDLAGLAGVVHLGDGRDGVGEA